MSSFNIEFMFFNWLLTQKVLNVRRKIYIYIINHETNLGRFRNRNTDDAKSSIAVVLV